MAGEQTDDVTTGEGTAGDDPGTVVTPGKGVGKTTPRKQPAKRTAPTAADHATASPAALVSDHGRTTIADAVVSKIAGIATREVPGVHALGGRTDRAVGAIRGRIPGSSVNVTQGISVEVGESQAAVDIQMIATYGYALSDLARDIRESIISAIEEMTALEVTEVNIEIQDVHLTGPEDEADEPERAPRVQ